MKKAETESGSSPRVRGKLAELLQQLLDVRLIPACAGKTVDLVRPELRGQAHPRVCGENARLQTFPDDFVGSSPRVRGKRHPEDAPPRADGLIPACAGKTTTALPSSVDSAAHPRVCGENILVRIPSINQRGSSPRVRGKR